MKKGLLRPDGAMSAALNGQLSSSQPHSAASFSSLGPLINDVDSIAFSKITGPNHTFFFVDFFGGMVKTFFTP